MRFEAKEVGDSMDEIRMQRARRTSAQPAPITDEDMINEGGYEDPWPGRLPSSSRRYVPHADVRPRVPRPRPVFRRCRETGSAHPIARTSRLSTAPVVF